MKALLTASVVCLWLQQPQTPVFRGSTDVVVANVQVTGQNGAPVDGLTLADFALKVDGRPRAIASVEFQRIDEARSAKFDDAANSTLSMGPAATAQSFVMIVADPFMMRPDSSRLLFDQAAEFVATLPSAHAVSLWLLPARRPQFPFSENRLPIVAALKRQLGGLGATTKPTAGDTLAALSGIDAAIDTLAAADGRRTLVFFSDSLPPFLKPDDPADNVRISLRAITRRAADAGVVIHTVTTAPPAFIDTARRAVPLLPNGDRVLLPMLSDLTGGLFLERGSNGSSVLPRIERLLTAQYVLSFNVESADKDGKPHKIDVKVDRKGVNVTFRKEFVR